MIIEKQATKQTYDKVHKRIFWELIVVSAMKRMFPGDKEVEKVTVPMIKNLHLDYIQFITSNNILPIPLNPENFPFIKWNTGGYKVMNYLKNKWGYSQNIITAFILALFDSVKKGQINYKLYDPEGYMEKNKIKDKYFPNKFMSFFDIDKLIILGAIGLGIMLFK